MVSTEVQRTLVKSPPELWAELSDPHALARHLGELGEIRITRAEPESKVEWEAEGASGTVLIKPAGWGTRVTLSLTQDADPPQKAAPAPQKAAPAPRESASAPEPQRSAPEPQQAREPDEPEGGQAREQTQQPERAVAQVPRAELRQGAAEQGEPAAAAAEPAAAEPAAAERAAPVRADAHAAPRTGFFARLFGRGRRRGGAARPEPRDQAGPEALPPTSREIAEETATSERLSEGPRDIPAQGRAPEQLDAFAALRRALAPEAVAAVDLLAAPTVLRTAGHESGEQPDTEQQDTGEDLAAEPEGVEVVAADEMAALLTAVLDRLGAAHHRPFSRS